MSRLVKHCYEYAFEERIANGKKPTYCKNSCIQVFSNASFSYEIHGVPLRCPVSCDLADFKNTVKI